jgi:hypothetical protein
MKEKITKTPAGAIRQPFTSKGNVKIFAGILIALLTALTVLISPTAWAGPDQGATPRATSVSGTWVGQVEHHDAHFDYVGSPCPTEAKFCILTIARYRIVPITGQAQEALPSMSGRKAQLQGTLVKTDEGTHQGALFVQRIRASN